MATAINVLDVTNIIKKYKQILNARNCHFKVDPKDLQNEAVMLEGQIRGLRRLFDVMLDKVDSTKHYWLGDAAEQYRSEFANKKEYMEEAIKLMTEYVNDLNQIASTYTGVEKANVEMANQLSSDVIL